MTETLYSYDPRTGERFGDPLPITDPAGLDRSVRAAATAAPAWGSTALPDRARALRAVADALDGSAGPLVDQADRETALGATRLSGELGRTTAQLRMFAELVEDGGYLDVIITPGGPGGRPDVRRMQTPIGPVAVFAASNFPFAFSVAGGDTASALAVGCPVIVKAHEGHPATSAAVAAVIRETLARTGAPDGVFDVVYGPEIGAPLVRSPNIRAVGFTGSTAGGRALFDVACSRPDPIPFFGELGSVNPVVVLPGAARENARQIASGYVQSLTMGAGQFCTNPNLLLVPAGSSVLEELPRALAGAAGAPLLTAKVAAAYRDSLADPRWRSLELVGAAAMRGPWDGSVEVRRVELGHSAATPDLLNVERFGPAGLVATYDAPGQLDAAMAQIEGSLTISVHAADSDHEETARLLPMLARRAGRVVFNGWPTGVAVCWAMHHGGPWPATTASAHTSVGGTALRRWLIPVAYQDVPDPLLPAALRSDNPLGLPRTVQP